MLKHAIQGAPLDLGPFGGNRRRARRGPQAGLRASRHHAASIFVRILPLTDLPRSMPWTHLGNHDKTLAGLEKNAAKAHNLPTQFCTLSIPDPLDGAALRSSVAQAEPRP